MFGADTTQNQGDYTDKNGDAHHFTFFESKTSDGYTAVYTDVDTKTNATWTHTDTVSGNVETVSDTHQGGDMSGTKTTSKDSDGNTSKTQTTTSPVVSTSENSNTDGHGNSNSTTSAAPAPSLNTGAITSGTTTKTDGHGNTTTTTDETNDGHHTTTTTTTTTTTKDSIPSDDPDSHAGAPHVPIKQLLAADAALHIGPGSHDGDNVNVTNSDVPGTVSANDLKGGKVDGNQHLLGGDTSFENYSQQGGHIGGTPQPNYNGQAGAIDPGPDGNGAPQTDGPSPRDTHHPIETDPAARAGTGNSGDHGTQGGQTNDRPLVISHFTEGNAAQFAQELAKAAETSGQKTETSDGHTIANHTDHDLASVTGSTPAPHDGHDDFAIVLHAANNPAAFGLLDHAAANEADTSGHLPIHTEFAIHLPEIHVEAAPVAPAIVDHHINVPHLEPFSQLHH